MSDKYTTEQMVKWAKNLYTWEVVSDTLIRDAIIERLRKADVLFEAAKEAETEIRVYHHSCLYIAADLRKLKLTFFSKAIADY